ncbi:hybrid sensor histidine kinase/response regulator transcription factor [Aliikangiella coralliicola]|uniref:histidine kinase n=1 Tax=Aliikangiella coralliicola TaxID=2592383 RepID=A0A545U7T4_9GAMM|nr:two-component regulator propeller domain-containing protein [Aliikangiella coralliicola]TQV85532.1 response regulator [Aliikangiella coralliicola]
MLWKYPNNLPANFVRPFKLQKPLFQYYSLIHLSLEKNNVASQLKTKIIKYSLAFTLCFYIATCIAEPTVKFSRIGEDAGLPHQTVIQIAQDENGLIWMATFDGLVNFDGYETTVFRNKEHSHNSIAANTVFSIELQDNGIVWTGTNNGLSRFDTKTKNFTNFKHDPSNPLTINSNLVYTISDVDENTLWIGTNIGIDRINKKTGEVEHLLSFSGKTKEFTISQVNKILTTKKNKNVWIAYYGGLLKYDKKNNIFIDIPFPGQGKVIVYSLYESISGRLFAGTNKGLFVYNETTKKVESFHDTLHSIEVKSITEDYKNNLWIGTADDGVYVLNNSKTLSHHKNERSNTSSISDNTITSLMTDFNGSIWLGTRNNGLNWVDPKTTEFKLYDNRESSFSCLRSIKIQSVLKRKNNITWLGTEKGLAKVNLDDNKCELYTTNSIRGKKLVSDNIFKLFEDSSGNIYIGTNQGPNYIAKNQTNIDNIFGNTIDTLVFDFFEDESGNLYIGTVNGVYYKKKELTIPTKINVENNDVIYAYNILQQKNKRVLVATWQGLFELTPSLTLKKSNLLPPKWQDKPIRKIFQDSQERLWIGIENIGLFGFDIHDKLILAYTDSEKLHAIKKLYSIVESASGDLWVGSDNGISRITPSTNTIYNYHKSDGLQSNYFEPNSAIIDSDENMYFGGKKGLNIFNPSDIEHSKHPPKVNIRKLFYFNKEVQPGKDYNGFKLDKDISYTTDLTLTHKDYIIGFEFAGIHFGDPKRNQYAYQLSGYDKDWIYTDASYRRANYNNLSAGDYVFKVKAANKHGLWSQPKEINIKVLPPFWMTKTAYLIYFLTIVLAIYSFVTYRTKALTKRSQELEKSVNRRTEELAKEKNKVEQLLSRKNEEFANVSHEFRTPLTLILGPISQILKKNRNDEDTHRLNVVQRNGYRLLRMVDQLLNMETFRVKSITQKSPQAFAATIKLIAEAFADVAKEKGIHFSIKQLDEVYFEFTPDALEKIVLNMLSNAIKYTKPGGNISIESVILNKQLRITVTDSGIGIPQDKQKQVFERFNRVLDEQSEQITGAGIGLALTKELVEAHQGKINLTSALGEGTTITVTLPIINPVGPLEVSEHSNEEIIAMELMSVTDQINSSESEILVESDQVKQNSILIIEDNNDMRNYIVESVQTNYQVLTAKDGKEGVEVATREIPDIIISDIMMPKLDGYQVTSTLRAQDATNHIPIILLTAKGDRESRLKGWHEKADEYLTKPFDVEELLIRIQNLLEIRDILRQRFSQTVFDASKKLHLNEEKNTTINQPDIRDSQFIEKLNRILNTNYQSSDLRINYVAKEIAMSERQLLRKLKSILNMSCSEYIKRYRLEKACELLKQGHAPSSTGFDVGFSSHSHFAKCFKAQYGCSPSHYAKLLNTDDSSTSTSSTSTNPSDVP